MNRLVLVADDDTAMRELISMTLQRDGLETAECCDGLEVLARLRAVQTGLPRPAVVLSDVQMPGATGLDVLHWASRFLPDVPVVLITAFGDRLTHERARMLGAVRVIDKPFDLSQLSRCIAQVMETDAS